ncbi:hypothetical protein GCM10017767_04760 [Halomonas urumqiensis]|nr:hypothetical protein GCM10017767_04760 [Halomonas urumqiensis]
MQGGGVYRAPANLARGLELSPEVHCQRLPAASCGSRDALLDALASGLAFPDHFGHNWDAAWDCMTELTWNDDKPRIILCPLVDESADSGLDNEVLPAPMAAFLEVMGDACAHWSAHERTLYVIIVHQDGRVPTWLSTIEPFPGHQVLA